MLQQESTKETTDEFMITREFRGEGFHLNYLLDIELKGTSFPIQGLRVVQQFEKHFYVDQEELKHYGIKVQLPDKVSLEHPAMVSSGFSAQFTFESFEHIKFPFHLRYPEPRFSESLLNMTLEPPLLSFVKEDGMLSFVSEKEYKFYDKNPFITVPTGNANFAKFTHAAGLCTTLLMSLVLSFKFLKLSFKQNK
eukprot:snap_masked-scaffold_3-processed-gene-4.34-mRNA-1 protein AED:1.00 eAED:1.00 QI:0/-1/0/0/-1/1/1/0/193